MRQVPRMFTLAAAFIFALVLASYAPPVNAAACEAWQDCNVAERDATSGAKKTINVDAAGTVLVGGSGSRVELLYSGTHTTLTGAGAGNYAPIRGAFTPPTWCKTVVFTARIDAIVIGAGATLVWAGSRYDSNGEVFTTSAGAERGMEASAVVTPTVNNGVVLSFGPELPSLNTTYSGTTVYSVPTPPLPQIGFVYNWTTAPDSWSVRWTAHCIGG